MFRALSVISLDMVFELSKSENVPEDGFKMGAEMSNPIKTQTHFNPNT